MPDAFAVASTTVYSLCLLYKVGAGNLSIPCIKSICIGKKLRAFRSFSSQKLAMQWAAGRVGLPNSLLIAGEDDWVTLDCRQQNGERFFRLSGVLGEMHFRSRCGGPDFKPAGFLHCRIFIQVLVR